MCSSDFGYADGRLPIWARKLSWTMFLFSLAISPLIFIIILLCLLRCLEINLWIHFLSFNCIPPSIPLFFPSLSLPLFFGMTNIYRMAYLRDNFCQENDVTGIIAKSKAQCSDNYGMFEANCQSYNSATGNTLMGLSNRLLHFSQKKDFLLTWIFFFSDVGIPWDSEGNSSVDQPRK